MNLRRAKPADDGLPAGMIPADKLAASRLAGTDTPAPAGDPELLARRARLVEQFALLQSELGGLTYEMAIRDHIRADVLARKAAYLQRVDIELAQVDRMLRGENPIAADRCPSCNGLLGRADAFCAGCGQPAIPAPDSVRA